MRKLPSRKLLASIVAGALFIPQSGFTLGLGEIEVDSALNQKLLADIELLSATPEDAENIIVKLASRKEFSRAGLDRPYLLSDLRFKSEVIEGVPHIKVTSGSPIREPFLNFLIEVDWPNGHLLREYTVLLDPPVFMTKAPVNTADSRPASASATESRPASSATITPVPVTNSTAAAPATPIASTAQNNSAPTSTTQSFIPAPVVQQQTPANQQSLNQPPGSYKVKSGDTSWSLADALRPNQSVTVPQMMFAMLRANPESFINENINGLKRGYILRVPDAEQIAEISQADAQAMMNEHWALWRQYQQAQTGGQPVSAMKSDGAADASGAGDGTQANDNAHLAIVSAGTGTSSAGLKNPSEMTSQELRAELLLARERVETERVEKEALQSRINALEQNVEQREGLLAIEDEGLSGVQSLNTTSDAATSDAANDAMAGAVDTETMDEIVTDAEPAESQTAQSDAVDEMAGEITDEAADGTVMAAEQDGDTASDAVFTDEVADQGADQAIDGQIVDEMPEQTALADDAASQPVSDERVAANPLEQLLNDPKLLAAAGGGLLLIAALIALMIKRRKTTSDDEPDVKSGFADLESLADDIAEENAEQAAVIDSTVAMRDTDSDDITGSEDTTELAVPEDDETTAVSEDDSARDDVIAEADVYLAYGIYQQAEDLLNQAITDNPDRNDYRIKLAETHYASKNATAFAEVASELKNRIEDEDSSEWEKIRVMGQDLCADDPMFEGAGIADLDLDESVADGPIMELDDDLNEEESTVVSDLDLTMDDTLELPEVDDGESDSSQSNDMAEEIVAAESITTEPVEEIEFDISDTGAVEESDTSEDDFGLDIDASELDIESLNTTDNTADENTDEIEEESMDLGDIDIGLDEDETVSDASTDAIHEMEDAAMQDTERDGAELIDTDLVDTDLEFGLDETTTEAEGDITAEDEIALDLSDEIAAEPLDDASLDESMVEATAAEEDAEETTAAETSVDDAVEIDNELSDAEPDIAPDADSVKDEPAAEAKTIPAANDDSADEDDFDLSSLDDVDEISTKLDLARAYLDMGDAEGTRGILEEVLVDGNDEQKQEANELLDKLA